jgi:outer membrane receptor protein involved in Fe transport
VTRASLLALLAGLAGRSVPAQEPSPQPPQTPPRLEERIVVVTPCRACPTTLVSAPAATTVITRDVVETSAAQGYGDLLRAIPGLNAVQFSARDVVVATRQNTSSLFPGLLAILDGRPLYLDFLGIVLWDLASNSPFSVEQIEVVRGPASAVWGANAYAGVVNIITRSPRAAEGGWLVARGGLFGRNAGSTAGEGAGTLYGFDGSVSRAPSEQLAYRISAGLYHSGPYARPTGRIPRVPHPLDPDFIVGGGFYPADEAGYPAYENRGTTQPRFDVRIDRELDGESSRLTLNAGVAGTDGLIYTGVGPLEIESGGYLAHVQAALSKGNLRVAGFANLFDVEGPILLGLTPDSSPIRVAVHTRSFDLGLSDFIGAPSQIISFGANVRQNQFNMTIAPAAEDRSEFGAYLQDEVFAGPFRLSLGLRADKFDNLDAVVLSPRIAAMYLVGRDHSLRLSYNRAFRSPSVTDNFQLTPFVTPVDLRFLTGSLPEELRPLVASPLPIAMQLRGSPDLKAESLRALELAYVGTFNERTTVGLAAFVSDRHDIINLTTPPSDPDLYTEQEPPPGWPLPASVLADLARQGIFIPRTAGRVENLGPVRMRGFEASLDHRVSRAFSGFANYSWQDEPEPLPSADPFPTHQLAVPPRHRVNIGVNLDGPRYLGSLAVHHATRGFWTDVLNETFHGWSPAYTLVNAAFGVRFSQGKVVAMVKATNLIDQDIQQHIFGDIFKRSLAAEVRFAF